MFLSLMCISIMHACIYALYMYKRIAPPPPSIALTNNYGTSGRDSVILSVG